MTQYTNAEIRVGRHTIRVDVTVDSYTPISTATPEWTGVLRPPNNTGLAPGQTYTLVLPGYSPAHIRVTSEANPIDGTVTFCGVSDMPTCKAPA